MPLNILVNIHNLVLAIKYQRVYISTCQYNQFYEEIQIPELNHKLIKKKLKLKFTVVDTYKMNKVRELKIDSTLWATPARLVNLLDFKSEKKVLKTKVIIIII